MWMRLCGAVQQGGAWPPVPEKTGLRIHVTSKLMAKHSE